MKRCHSLVLTFIAMQTVTLKKINIPERLLRCHSTAAKETLTNLLLNYSSPYLNPFIAIQRKCNNLATANVAILLV